MNYIDLRLPSKTLWAEENSTIDGEELVNFVEAQNVFGKNIPTWKDFMELRSSCRHHYDKEKKGSVFTGPNGNTVFFPCRDMKSFSYIDVEKKTGRTTHSEGYSRYWSRTPLNEKEIHHWCLIVQENLNAHGFPFLDQNKFNVRLIKKQRGTK